MEKMNCKGVSVLGDGGSISFDFVKTGVKITLDNLGENLVNYVLNFSISDKGTDRYGKLFIHKKTVSKKHRRGRNKIHVDKKIVKDPKELELVYKSVLEYQKQHSNVDQYVEKLSEYVKPFLRDKSIDSLIK